MTTATIGSPSRSGAKPAKRGRALLWSGVLGLGLIGAMAFDTHVVRIGTSGGEAVQGFSAEAYGPAEFPKIQAAIGQRAVDAVTLANAIKADADAAAKKYGVQGSVGSEISVKFTGTVGEGKRGIYTVAVPGMPEDVHIRMQTGPAINGMDIRDATGMVSFGKFRNQIDYQNAGTALNNEMKKQVLAGIDMAKLSGKTINVTGVFQLINPSNWLVTPVELKVK
ncbi:DUF2291 domain-containing protein [Kozakia baliensis]|uniref:DUF2291 family protein n=1 Tax=Kozakia baliensis TaxID=153496 RepID=UPI00345C4DF7